MGCASSLLFPLRVRGEHGLNNYKDTKTKCRLYWCLIEFIDWRDSHSYWYFRPSFVNYCPSNFLFSLPPPPLPPFPKSKVYTDSVWLGGGGGVLSFVGDRILQEFDTDKIHKLQICFTTPNKNLGWEGASDK